MNLFGKDEVNLSRQFEFDFAKAVCILGMVFVHCFETLAAPTTESSTAYYIMVIVLDSVFGAGTFMMCMGLGIAYSWKENANKLIKRGIMLFLFGYLLNLIRDGIPRLLLVLLGKESSDVLTMYMLCDDIMPFAGLALMLFGILKKMKFSDLAVLLTALGMSVLGSFVRFLDCGSTLWNELAGLFVGTYSRVDPEVFGCFPLLNWFIIVVVGYLYAKAIRRCRNINLYYAISFPVSAVILAVYMLISIPNGLGMMNGDIFYYYHFSTPNVLILFTGTVFATGLYHFIALPFGSNIKKIITRMSSNINRIYCIHWVIVCWTSAVFTLVDYEGFGNAATFAVGVVIFIAANILAEIYTGKKESCRSIKQ